MAVGRGGATGISGRPGRGGFLAVSQAEQGSDRDDLSKPSIPQTLSRTEAPGSTPGVTLPLRRSSKGASRQRGPRGG